MTTVPQNMPSTHESGATPTVAPSTAPKPDTSSTGNNTNLPSQSSGAPQSTAPSNNTQSPSDTMPPSQPEEGYPEQKHAGAVGYGPNYSTKPSLEEKIEGLKEELKGKVTRKPELVQHGKEIMSGEDKKKKLTGEDEPNPFQSVDEDEKKVNPQGNDMNQGMQASQGKSPSQSQTQGQPQSQPQSQPQPSESTPQTTDQSRPFQESSSGSPSINFRGEPAGSQDHPVNTSHDVVPPSSSTQPSGQATTGTRPEFAQHGMPRPNPAGMAINQGQGDAAKEQAATVAPEGTREAEKQRQGNSADFAARPVDARQ